MQRHHWLVLVGAGSMCAAAVFQVTAGFAASPTLWQVIALVLSGAFALVVGVLSFVVAPTPSKNPLAAVVVLDNALYD